jgi:hypothetical protein
MDASSKTNSDQLRGEPGSPEREHQFHTYVGARIPWYVRLIWLGFWTFAVAYVILYLFPALRVEITSPP